MKKIMINLNVEGDVKGFISFQVDDKTTCKVVSRNVLAYFKRKFIPDFVGCYLYKQKGTAFSGANMFHSDDSFLSTLLNQLGIKSDSKEVKNMQKEPEQLAELINNTIEQKKVGLHISETSD